MKDLINVIFGTPTATLLVIAGLVFLLLAVVGNVAGKIEPGKYGRITSGIIGGILLAIGLSSHFHGSKEDSNTEQKPNIIDSEAGNKAVERGPQVDDEQIIKAESEKPATTEVVPKQKLQESMRLSVVPSQGRFLIRIPTTRFQE